MKIGILTLPLHSNYGGLLQAWALQMVLTRMGHEAIIINRVRYCKSLPLWHRILSCIKNEVYVMLGKRKLSYKLLRNLKSISEQHVRKFRYNRYSGISQDIMTDADLNGYIFKEDFDAYIVGSDQVWRPKYSPNLMTYFLDFIKNDDSVIKIAYAASFGVDEWEFSEEQTIGAAELAPFFDLITVRESSGIAFVEKYLNCKATHVLDPTMLLDKEDYTNLIEHPTCSLHESKGNMFCYVLDRSANLNDIIFRCSAKTGLRPYHCNYITPYWQIEDPKKINDCIVPPVEQWLKSFMDAKMVVTDSFHGVVFSIIFNKPFWVVANISRGAARFTSLLEQFNLKDRIVLDSSEIDWGRPIDWNEVNNIRSNCSTNSISILNTYLSR